MMRLTGIQLKNFKRLVDFQAVFSPGINVVKGPLNEMGKSTLLEGIIAALFYSPKSTSRDIRDYASWGSNRQYATSLEFEDGASRYLLEKDFDKGTIRLVEHGGREEIDTVKEVSEKLAGLLGTRSEKLFLCSACIRQAQVSQVSAGKKEIGQSLEEIVTGGEESTLASHVIQKLDAKIAEMKKGLDSPAKTPGVLAGLRKQLQECLQRHGVVRDEVSRVEAQKIKLTEANRQLVQVKAEHENALVLLDKNKRRKDIEVAVENLTRDYNAAEELLGRIRAQQESSRKADEALGAMEGFADKQSVSALREKLDDVRRKREDIQSDLTECQKELAEIRAKLEGKRQARLLGSAGFMAAAIAVLTGGIVGTLAGPRYLAPLIVLGAAFLMAAMWARTSLVRERTAVSGVEERIHRMGESLGELAGHEQVLLAETGCATVAQFDEKEKRYYHWLETRAQAELRLEVLLAGKSLRDIEAQRSDLVRKLAVQQDRLTEDMMATRLSPEEFIALEKKVRDLGARAAELEDARRDSMAIIRAAGHDAEEQVSLEEELDGLQQTLRHEERRVVVYQLTRDVLSRARSEVLSSSEQALEQEIQAYLSVFTDGRYGQVRMSKEDLEFWVYSDEKEDWARPEELSGGVVDEFYLAFRLAVVRLVFGDRRPPLILDDPFVNFDSVRLANTLNLLRKLSSDYQIIIFTLSDLYDGVA
ncbi:MAG: AAA family ATPase, partial [Dehalococcoidia bacterium]|nr:AAA family ATPase [Dehalococcoidia bacterium]